MPTTEDTLESILKPLAAKDQDAAARAWDTFYTADKDPKAFREAVRGLNLPPEIRQDLAAMKFYPKGQNNPGNLRKPSGVYRVFGTPRDGWKALKNDIQTKISGGSQHKLTPDSTLLRFFEVYAPEGDNNDPEAYAQFVANRLGVTTQTPISQLSGKVDDFARAIAQQENAKVPWVDTETLPAAPDEKPMPAAREQVAKAPQPQEDRTAGIVPRETSTSRREGSLTSPLVNVSQFVPPPTRDQSGVRQFAQGAAKGFAEGAEGLTSPANIGIYGAMRGAAAIPVVGPYIAGAAGLAMTAQMAWNMVTSLPEAKAAWDAGDYGKLGQIVGQDAVDALMLKHSAGRGGKALAEGRAGKSAASEPAEHPTEHATASKPSLDQLREEYLANEANRRNEFNAGKPASHGASDSWAEEAPAPAPPRRISGSTRPDRRSAAPRVIEARPVGEPYYQPGEGPHPTLPEGRPPRLLGAAPPPERPFRMPAAEGIEEVPPPIPDRPAASAAEQSSTPQPTEAPAPTVVPEPPPASPHAQATFENVIQTARQQGYRQVKINARNASGEVTSTFNLNPATVNPDAVRMMSQKIGSAHDLQVVPQGEHAGKTVWIKPIGPQTMPGESAAPPESRRREQVAESKPVAVETEQKEATPAPVPIEEAEREYLVDQKTKTLTPVDPEAPRSNPPKGQYRVRGGSVNIQRLEREGYKRTGEPEPPLATENAPAAPGSLLEKVQQARARAGQRIDRDVTETHSSAPPEARTPAPAPSASDMLAERKAELEAKGVKVSGEKPNKTAATKAKPSVTPAAEKPQVAASEVAKPEATKPDAVPPPQPTPAKPADVAPTQATPAKPAAAAPPPARSETISIARDIPDLDLVKGDRVEYRGTDSRGKVSYTVITEDGARMQSTWEGSEDGFFKALGQEKPKKSGMFGSERGSFSLRDKPRMGGRLAAVLEDSPQSPRKVGKEKLGGEGWWVSPTGEKHNTESSGGDIATHSVLAEKMTGKRGNAGFDDLMGKGWIRVRGEGVNVKSLSAVNSVGFMEAVQEAASSAKSKGLPFITVEWTDSTGKLQVKPVRLTNVNDFLADPEKRLRSLSPTAENAAPPQTREETGIAV